MLRSSTVMSNLYDILNITNSIVMLNIKDMLNVQDITGLAVILNFVTTIYVISVNIEFLIPCVPLVLVFIFHDIQKLTASNFALQKRLSADVAEVKRTLKSEYILRFTA